MQALHAHSYEEQLLHCEEGLAELGRVTREDGTGLQHLTQNLSYTLQLDMAECYACMVSSICPCQVNPICSTSSVGPLPAWNCFNMLCELHSATKALEVTQFTVTSL